MDFFFLNRKIHVLNIAVDSRESTGARTHLLISLRLYTLRGETELLISYRSIMALIVRKASGSLPMLMSTKGEKEKPINHLLHGCNFIRCPLYSFSVCRSSADTTTLQPVAPDSQISPKTASSTSVLNRSRQQYYQRCLHCCF